MTQQRPPRIPGVSGAPPELFRATVSAPPRPISRPVTPLASPLDTGDIEELGEDDLIETEDLDLPGSHASPALATPPARVAPVSPVAQHPDRDARAVLVVEDDASIRAMIVRALSPTYTVYDATDGQDALRVLAAIAPPACIVSDWMMPRMDGLALAKHVRSDKNLKQTPVIFLTGKNGPLDVVTGINAGVRHYLAKPFKMKELTDKLATIVGKR